jgi:hypothetical protein
MSPPSIATKGDWCAAGVMGVGDVSSVRPQKSSLPSINLSLLPISLQENSFKVNARLSSAELIMLLSVSYSTILFLLLLIFLSPRIFLILLAVIAIICTVLENFVKPPLLNSLQYLRLRFGTWCFSSSIVSIGLYFSLCFIKLIHAWIGQFIQLSLSRLHFPDLHCGNLLSTSQWTEVARNYINKDFTK